MEERKSLRLNKLFSGRVIRNARGFGWLVNSLTNITETTTWVDSADAEHQYGNTWKITPHYKSETKYFVEIEFLRDSDWYQNLPGVKVLEVFYNIFFTIRRILGALLPMAWVLLFGFFILWSGIGSGAEKDALLLKVLTPIVISTFAWIFLLVLETTFSAIARGILKVKDEYAEAFRRISNGHSGFGDDISVPKKIFLSVLSLLLVGLGFFIGGMVGSAVAQAIEATTGAALVKSQVPKMITVFAGMPIILFTIVMTMIKIWKGRTSRILFMLLNVLVTAALIFLVMIF